MKIKDVMTKNVACISPTSTIIEAARLMQKHNVGVIPVCDATKMVGIVTDRDIVVRNIANGTGVDKEVRDIMTSDVKTVTKDMDVEDATNIMSEAQVRRLPVLEDNKVIGMVSIGDIATINNRLFREAGETLGHISTPSNPDNMR
ncbi:MAG: CBS domain-containing protein [Clostridiales bacterium]|nr:CBS domain-containing protein [Clostridiales bacterium]